MKMYRSLRGKMTTTIPYGQLNEEDRFLIMHTYVLHGTKEAMKRHNVAYATIHHIKFHCPDIHERALKMAALPVKHFRECGLNSIETANKLGWDLNRVNKLWEYAL